MMSLYEKRPLKKPRIGPPDVYPQEPKQKEDELTSLNVKHGFATMPQLSDEFGTARNCNVTASKVGAYFNAIIAKKEELCTLPDSGRKRQQINPKDNFWPAIVRNKHCIEAWFKDLVGNKPLMALAKRAPSFNKKEEIFMMLSEYQVPMLRAAWFIKLSSAYTIAVSEAKNKKRQLPDPTTEWTATLIKFLKDQLPKLQDYYHQSNDKSQSQSMNMTTTGVQSSMCSSSLTTPPLQSPAQQTNPLTTTSESDYKTANRQWVYCTQLSKYMYEEGLLDRQEFLTWILELLDKMRCQSTDDSMLKLLLPLALQYLDEFILSELLSRRLAYLCTKKLSFMCSSIAESNLNLTSPQSEVKSENGPTEKDKKETLTLSPLQATMNEYLGCPHHRDIIMMLSTILQVITLECPTAMVWCGIGENRSGSVWHGSPLDALVVPPSQLPLPSRNTCGGILASGESTTELRKRLRQVESSIRERSRKAEVRWCADKWQTSSAGVTTTRVLAALDALDRHRFDRIDANNSLDTLYMKIFSPPSSRDSSNNTSSNVYENKENRNEYNVQQDEPIVQILCEWAVSAERWGEHRAMAVAWLLDKRQADAASVSAETNIDAIGGGLPDDKDSVSSLNNQIGGLPTFQQLLMRFLDNDAPVLEENGSQQNRTMFTNLVHLFAELIRHDVFSHDAYMCTLISRGDLLSCSNSTRATSHPATPPQLDEDVFGIDLKPNKSDDHGRSGMDYDDSKIDDDLDKILQRLKEDQQNSMDAPDSPKEPDSHGHHANMITPNMSIPIETDHGVRPLRHLLYATHFPLTQDETFSQHDCNQRHVLLYGVGRVRDEARHAVKKMSKEICKLFSKKFSIDVAEGGKVKKHSRSEFNFESTTQKCQNLSYFDQHVVTWQCGVTVVEMLNGFASGNSNYLPVQEHVAFLFDLMELALNIYGLIDACIQILKELPEVEAQLLAKNSTLARNYTTSLSLYVVGVLRRYHCCLLLSAEQTSAVFEGLCRVVKHVSNPGDCSSAERCVLAHLYDLYSSCSMLKAKPHTEPFGNAYPKIRQALYSALQPSPSSNYVYNPQYVQEVFANPKRGGKIESNWARQLAESSNNRYSFVTNAIVAACRETDNERLNDLSVTCAEATACCNGLSAEWLGALMALCCSSNHSNFYTDLLAQVDVQDLSIHNSLATFTSVLIARHCFSLEDFVKHIALPSLVKVKASVEGRGDSTSGGSSVNGCGAEAGARLTCHLLLRLFKTVECPQPGLYSVSTSPHPLPSGSTPGGAIRLSCDRHLLSAAHNNIKVGPVLAVLKAILVVGDATAREGKSGKRDNNCSSGHTGSTLGGKTQSGNASELSHILGTSDILAGNDDGSLDLMHSITSSEGPASLSAFAWHVLREICSQQWVLERCLSQPEELCHSDMLLDPMLTAQQAQRLLHMICYPDAGAAFDGLDQRTVIARILENLEQWTLRMSWLDLQLMFKQFNSNSSELNQWLDTVAKAVIDVFQLNSYDAATNDKFLIFKPEHGKGKSSSIWLVAPLVSKLPSAVQGRVLKIAGQVLETNNWPTFGTSSGKRILSETGKDGGGSRSGGGNCVGGSGGQRRINTSCSPSLLSHRPFLSLILTCLKGQDDQREGLLASLHSQLSQFLSLGKDERTGTCETDSREAMLDALQLRFSLVGGMFDTVQRNAATTTDWAVLLVQLIGYGVIDLNNNSELFTTVVDMLATLVHSTLVSDSQSEKDESKKHYQNLMKKLKKELGDRNSPSIQYVRQLLQLPKRTCEIIASEPVGCLTDTKGNKITGFDCIDKKQGLQVSDKQRVSPWDLLEGQKSPAPLSWAWFGAVRLERKRLWYEDTHRLLKYHTHSMLRPAPHYLDPVPLPPEDLEPVTDKPLKDCDLKADTPSSVDQSPRSAALNKARGGKGARRSRKPKGSCGSGPGTPGPVMPGGGPTVSQTQQSLQQQNLPMTGMNMQGVQTPPQVNHMGAYSNQMGAPNGQQGFPANQGIQQWGYPQQQQNYYGQQMPTVSRFERPQINQSKQALSNMLRQRHPLSQLVGTGNTGTGPGAGPYPGMQRQFARQQIRSSMQPNQAMFQQQYSNIQQGINQNYGGYGNANAQQSTTAQMLQAGSGGGVANNQAGMIQPNSFQAQSQSAAGSFVGPPGSAMLGQRGAGATQTDYLAQQQRVGQPTRPQYLQAPNVTMNTMGPLSGMGNAQGGPVPPYSRTAGGGKPTVQPNQSNQQFQQQVSQHQRIRQQMMAMQQVTGAGGPGGGGTSGSQPTPALVAHLQRQMQQQQQQQPQQHNPYQPPPY